MKKLLVIFLTVILTFLSCFTMNYIYERAVNISANSYHRRVNLVIDAGHGGIDAGTLGVDGSEEKGINLDIALKLRDFALISGINTVLTREGDFLVYDKNDDSIILVYEGKQKNTDEVMNVLKNRLPDYMIPQRVIRIKSMPINTNGKIDRNRLISEYKNF